MLEYLQKAGKIDLEETSEKIMLEKRRNYLKLHKYAFSYDASKKLWRTTIPDPNTSSGRKYLKKKTKEELEEAIIDYYIDQEKRSKYTVKTSIQEFIDYHYDNESQRSTKRKAEYVYKRFFSEIGDKIITDMSESDFTIYLEKIVKEKHPKRKAYNEACSLLKRALKYLKKRSRISIDVNSVFDNIENNKRSFDTTVKSEEAQRFDTQESKKLVSYLWENREDPRNLLLLLIYVTGLRCGEANSLKHSDIGKHVIHVRRTLMGNFYDDSGKNVQVAVKDSPKTEAGERDVVISSGSDKILQAVKGLNPFSEYIFLNDKGELFSESAIRCHLLRVCDKLKIPRRPPHALRKTYASILDESRIENAAIISQLGHTKIETTKKFYIKDRNTVEEMRNKLDEISDLNMNEMMVENF